MDDKNGGDGNTMPEKMEIQPEMGGDNLIPDDNRKSKIQELCSLAEFENFERLLPGYIEWQQTKEESIEKPLVHGTGSYALRRILKEGFSPQHGGGIGGGESTYTSQQKFGDKPNPVSFAALDTNGEIISHWYAMLNSSEPGLTFNSQNMLGERIDRVITDIYGGAENVINRRLKEATTPDMSEEQIQAARNEIEKSMRHKIIERGRRVANVFDPEYTKARIARGESLMRGEVGIEEAEEILRDFEMIKDKMEDQNTPLYETAKVIKTLITACQDPKSHNGEKLAEKVERDKKNLRDYEHLSEAEKQEMRDQFPCFIMIEGSGVETPSDWFGDVVKEVHSFSNVPTGLIKEIQVPEVKIAEVETWLEEAGLKGKVRIIPIEYFEIQEAIRKMAA